MNISINLILCILTGLSSYQAFLNINLKRRLLFHPYTVAHQQQWYRFISHGFVHADFVHLFLNLFVLFQFGEIVEKSFAIYFGDLIGRIAYLSLYVSAIAFASLPDFLIHRYNPGYSAVGASGAISAVVFSYILLFPWLNLYLFLIVPIPGVVAAFLYLAYSSYMSKNANDNIGHTAHFYGAVYGVLFTIILSLLLNNQLIKSTWYQLLQGPTL